MAVIELDFHKKSNSENINDTKKATNQHMTALDTEEREFLCKFRQLKKFDQGRIIGKIDYFLQRY